MTKYALGRGAGALEREATVCMRSAWSATASVRRAPERGGRPWDGRCSRMPKEI